MDTKTARISWSWSTWRAKRFPWLVLLDRDWAAAHVTTIFGDERGNAAWEADLTFCAPYDDTVTLLSEYYERAVDTLQPNKQPAPRGDKPDPDEYLAAHLTARYYRGQLPLNDGIFQRFFDRAPAHARAHAVECVGRILYRTKEPLTSATRDRLIAFWNSRRRQSATVPDEHRGELTAFGWWFAAGKLDAAWELTELLAVLQIYHTGELDHVMLERLATLATDHPHAAVAALRAIAESERQHWTILGAETHVRAILAAALHDPGTRAAATALIHHLGILGYTKFRDLLQRDS